MGVISIILPVTRATATLDRTVLHTQYEAGLWPTEIILASAAGPEVAEQAKSLGVRCVDCTLTSVARGLTPSHGVTGDGGDEGSAAIREQLAKGPSPLPYPLPRHREREIDRAELLNCGAAAATGEVLLFLSPESLVPRRFAESIWWTLRRPAVVGGGFDFEFEPHLASQEFDRHSLTAVRLMNRIRFRWTGNFGIEQGIFVRREVFDRIGGFRSVSRLEDLYFSRAMKRLGRTATLGPAMQTSPRRFLRGGVIREFVTDLLTLLSDGLGGGGEKIKRNEPQLLASSDVVKVKD